MNAPIFSFVRYSMVSGLSFGANLFLTWFCHARLGASPELAFAVALLVVSFLNFALSRHWVFRASQGSLPSQLRGFVVTSASFRLLEYLSFLLVHTMLGIPYLMAAGSILFASFLAKFFVFRRRVFAT